ncbi:MAG: hypothetical protein ABI946_03865 [Chthoniobacterales bacterium]
MKHPLLPIHFAVLVLGAASFLPASSVCAAEPAVAFTFQGVDYFHRWSQKEQHEFTPTKQEDLEKWTDMITVNGYPSVTDGDGLAEMANGVLENYKEHGAKVLGTNSTPRTPDHPAEHLIAAVFGRPNFLKWPLRGFACWMEPAIPSSIRTASTARRSATK